MPQGERDSFGVPCSLFCVRRIDGFSNQEASQEDQQAQAPEDAEEDALAAATQVSRGLRVR